MTAPLPQLLAAYSPEFPCLLEGAANYRPLLAKTFEGDEVKQYIELRTPQYRDYDERDEPRVTARSATVRGVPGCPTRRSRSVRNRSTTAPTATRTRRRASRRFAAHVAGLRGGDGQPCPAGTPASEAEQAVINAMLAGETGRAVDSYGSLGSLLYGPVVRGGDGS